MYFPAIVEARVITLKIESTSITADNDLKISISVSNIGDEAAYNLKIYVDNYGTTQSSPLKDRLDVQETYNADFNFNINPKTPGRYALLIRVDYADANQYPFSAVSYCYYHYKEDTIYNIIGQINNIKLANKAKLALDLKNIDIKKKKCSIRLLLPKELSCKHPAKNVLLSPKGKKKINFNLTNFSALPGSNYQIYALIESLENNKYYSKAILGSIEIIKKEKLIKSYRWVLMSITCLLIAILIFYNLKQRRFKTKKLK